MENQDKYINRELTWLDFDLRVLEEAEDESNPLLERLKFLAITSSNLDEFFMVRVASIKQQIEAGFSKPDFSGLTPKEQLKRISIKCHELVSRQYRCFIQLDQLLQEQQITFLTYDQLSEEQKQWLERYFYETIFPVLTPLAVDASHPFPHLAAGTINIALLLREDDVQREENYYALVQAPGILRRFISLPLGAPGQFILLEDVILAHIDHLFHDYTVVSSLLFRMMRDADMEIDEDTADLMAEVEKSIRLRQWGKPVRMEIMQKEGTTCDETLLEFLKRELKPRKRDFFFINGPLDLTFLMDFYKISGYDHLRNLPQPPLVPAIFEEQDDIFSIIRKGDVMLHLPYDSFEPVVKLIRTAAADPNVLAIKQTLYRVSGNSPIVDALIKAAESGKQVTAVVELKARFDEENNILWARQLERAGCHVVYGLVGLKVHCKVLLIVRREEEGVRRYVHLSTGNYNESTAKLYTDLGIFTCQPSFGSDASVLFNLLTGFSYQPEFRKFTISPVGLREFFYESIDREISNALRGEPAGITAKVNSLIDQGIIDKLYEASAAGVPISLIVRGICGLRPNIPGLSDKISVISIVGRNLEHHRIFKFVNAGKPLYYLSSADWMPRNLDRRIEVCFPVEDEGMQERLEEILAVMLSDQAKARVAQQDGSYAHRENSKGMSSQQWFYDQARQRKNASKRIPQEFIVAEPPIQE